VARLRVDADFAAGHNPIEPGADATLTPLSVGASRNQVPNFNSSGSSRGSAATQRTAAGVWSRTGMRRSASFLIFGRDT